VCAAFPLHRCIALRDTPIHVLPRIVAKPGKCSSPVVTCDGCRVHFAPNTADCQQCQLGVQQWSWLFNSGTSCSLVCSPGYSVSVGRATATCINGTWSAVEASCVPSRELGMVQGAVEGLGVQWAVEPSTDLMNCQQSKTVT